MPEIEQQKELVESTEIVTKRCQTLHPATHDVGAMVPIAAFYQDRSQADGYARNCKDCCRTFNSNTRRHKKQKLLVDDELEAGKEDMRRGKSVSVSPMFILTEAIKLYEESGRTEQKIKLLELMAKYSPEMKNAKPQDKTAIIASIMESLEKEKKTDAIPKETSSN